jgi:SNF2 family DNA or RNA helicase
VKLVHRLHYAGHRTLIFSQSRLMLDIIQRVLAHYRFATHRIDGAVKSADRQRIIDDFNDTSEGVVGPTICLLTTKACGFGITLTGADRVIIYDPCRLRSPMHALFSSFL